MSSILWRCHRFSTSTEQWISRLCEEMSQDAGRSQVPWAESAGDVADYQLESSLGAYPFRNLLSGSFLKKGEDREPLRRSLPEHPNFWSDGSRVMEVSHFECVGAGFFARVSGKAWFLRELGHLDFLRPDDEGRLGAV